MKGVVRYLLEDGTDQEIKHIVNNMKTEIAQLKKDEKKLQQT
mgnify:CR=1 FL=1